MQADLAARPAAQVILCRSAQERERAQALFPALVAVYANVETDWRELEGRRVVCFGEELAVRAVGYAKEVKVVEAEIPADLAPAGALQWAKAQAVPYTENPVPQDAPQSSSQGAIGRVANAAKVAEVGQHSPAPSPPAVLDPTDALQGAQDDSEPPPWHDIDPEPEAPRSHWDPPYTPAEDWGEPLDVWGDDLGLPQIEARHLPPGISDYVLDQSALRGVDPIQVSLNTLIVLSGALHNGHAVKPKPGEVDYLERPVLWGACIGNASVKKSAAQTIALGNLPEIDLEMRRTVAKAMQERKESMQAYDAAQAAWAKSKEPRGEKPVAPEPVELPRMLVDNFTFESLRILEHNPRGKVLLVADELSQLFGSLDAYAKAAQDKDRPALLRLYESKPYLIDREQDRRAGLPPIYIRSWAASICGGIQPSRMAALAAKGYAEDGMLARFLLVHANPGSAGEERPADAVARAKYHDLIARMVAFIPPQYPCILSHMAQEIRSELLRWQYALMQSESGNEGYVSAIGKLEGIFPRLCLVYHAIACADARQPQVTPEISPDTAVKVRDLIKEVLVKHMSKFYVDLSLASTHLAPSRSICGLILAQGIETLTRRHVARYWAGWRKCSATQQRDIMQGLVDAAWIRPVSPTAWRVNPAAHAVFPERAAKAKAERAEAHRKLSELMVRARERDAGED